jgi:hypothetical protein
MEPIRQLVKDYGLRAKFSLVLGLAEPEVLSMLVIFETDQDLAKFSSCYDEKLLSTMFLNELVKTDYPKVTFKHQPVFLHSHETIIRHGGYGTYFR